MFYKLTYERNESCAIEYYIPKPIGLSGRGICKKLVNEVVYMMKLMMKNSDFHTGNVVSIELYRPVA